MGSEQSFAANSINDYSWHSTDIPTVRTKCRQYPDSSHLLVNLQPRCNDGHRKHAGNAIKLRIFMGSEYSKARRFCGLAEFGEFGAGDEIRTYDPNLGKRRIAPFTD
jgi:hypothetical protein